MKRPKLLGKQLKKRQFEKYKLFYSSLQEANLKSKSQSSYDYILPSHIQSNLFIQPKLGCYNIIWDQSCIPEESTTTLIFRSEPTDTCETLRGKVFLHEATVYRQTRVKPNVSHFSLGKGVWSMRSIIWNSLLYTVCWHLKHTLRCQIFKSKIPEPAIYYKYGLWWWHDYD